MLQQEFAGGSGRGQLNTYVAGLHAVMILRVAENTRDDHIDGHDLPERPQRYEGRRKGLAEYMESSQSVMWVQSLRSGNGTNFCCGRCGLRMSASGLRQKGVIGFGLEKQIDGNDTFDDLSEEREKLLLHPVEEIANGSG